MCRRCVGSDRECGGYGERKAAPQPSLFKKKLLPKLTVTTGLAPAGPKIAWSPTSGIRFQQEREYRYFRIFQDELAYELSNGFESCLWSKLVLQAADSQPIFQLTIATAALRQSTRMLWPDELGGVASHRQYALLQYGAALKGVQKLVSRGEVFLRTALISSLLIFCFETMLGDTECAVRNVQSALDIIHEQLARRNETSTHFQQNHLSIAIEEDILSAFKRLDRPGVALLGNASAPISNRRFGSTFQSFSYTIPRKFTSITEARKYLELIRYRILPKHPPDTELRTSFTPPEDTPGPVAHLIKLFSVTARYDNGEELIAQLEEWNRAFQHLFNFAKTKAGEEIFITAGTMHIESLSLGILLRGFSPSDTNFDHLQENLSASLQDLGPSELPVDSHLWQRTPSTFAQPSFVAARKILSHSWNLVKHPKFTKGFVFDAGSIPCLWSIIMLCPDRELKREATRILRSMDGRVECVWDSRTVAETGEKALAILEEIGGTEIQS